MTTEFAVAVLVLSLLAWLGQLISAVSPRLAVRLVRKEKGKGKVPCISCFAFPLRKKKRNTKYMVPRRLPQGESETRNTWYLGGAPKVVSLG